MLANEDCVMAHRDIYQALATLVSNASENFDNLIGGFLYGSGDRDSRVAQQACFTVGIVASDPQRVSDDLIQTLLIRLGSEDSIVRVGACRALCTLVPRLPVVPDTVIMAFIGKVTDEILVIRQTVCNGLSSMISTLSEVQRIRMLTALFSKLRSQDSHDMAHTEAWDLFGTLASKLPLVPDDIIALFSHVEDKPFQWYRSNRLALCSKALFTVVSNLSVVSYELINFFLQTL
ncbi:unnamed protein product [marine sediment metagenome]|uniref:Clathrin/coatomer adaptor adaptin-like N-terminal domain-containing protein n=1 Tax=marine sediment metagenome TaxID=412755 RepID=X0ZDU1_9ZZZZ